MPNQDEKEI